MKAQRVKETVADLTALDARLWASIPTEVVSLSPTPMAMVQGVSPLMAQRQDHGAVGSLRVQAVHDGSHLAIRVGWQMPEASTIGDLDQFADAVAVMFPMHPEAAAITMGSSGRAVNAWYWRAGDEVPFDVLAEGLGTSRRRDGSLTTLSASSRHADGAWSVLFVRPLRVSAEAASFEPGAPTRIAFSVWDGGRSERAAQKSASLAFSDFELGA